LSFALETHFHAAFLVAAIPGVGVAIVTALHRVDDAVAADVDTLAVGTRRTTCVAWLYQVACLRAAIAADTVAVVAGFARAQSAVPTNDGGDAWLARRGTLEVRLDLAHARTPVPWQSVAVVAVLAGLVQLSIAAGGACRHHEALLGWVVRLAGIVRLVPQAR
jgi:hypothetical protein